MRVAHVTPSCDLAAKCHLKREREVYKHVLTLALLDKTYAGKKTKSGRSKVKALFLEKGERGHPMCGLFVKTFPFLRSPSFSVVAARTCVLLLWTWKWNDLSVGGAFSFSQVYFLHCDLFAPSRCRRLIKCICLSHLAKCLLKTDDPWCSSIPCYLLFTTHTLRAGGCVYSLDLLIINYSKANWDPISTSIFPSQQKACFWASFVWVGMRAVSQVIR